MKKHPGGGRYDPDEEVILFVAGHNVVEIADTHGWNLIAVNNMAGQQPGGGRLDTRELRQRIDAGNRVLLDSGIFGIVQLHIAKHPGMTTAEGFGLPPDEVDGFDWLWGHYVNCVREFETGLWGYIELDQGGAENKRRTRARLEAIGLTPIPVFHPLNDPPDYFDELCSEYDRICVGNLVHLRAPNRRRLLTTLWERRRRYPDVWVHLLGVTPNEVCTALPISSADSSGFVSVMRFGADNGTGASAMGWSRFGRFDSTFTYDPSLDQLHDPGGRAGAVRFFASQAYFTQAGARRQQADLRELFGGDVLLPPIDPREGIAA